MPYMVEKKTPGLGALERAVAENIRMECARRNWSQSKLAEQMGFANGAPINKRWRGNDRPWSLADVEKAASLFGMRPSDLLRCAARDSNPEPSDLTPGDVTFPTTPAAGWPGYWADAA